MFVLARAATWSALFIAFVLVFLPSQVLSAFGVARPAVIGAFEVTGIAIAVVGLLIDLWCILSFALIGKGTPAPFDPPRRLVVRGPYRYVRNPMYLGAAIALCGAALLYRSLALAGYLLALALLTQALVVFYEEPTLTRTFGDDYTTYRTSVRRWLPRIPAS